MLFVLIPHLCGTAKQAQFRDFTLLTFLLGENIDFIILFLVYIYWSRKGEG